MSVKEKKIFAKIFQSFDSLFAQLKSFTRYDDSMLEKYGITEAEYDDYAGHYKNVIEEIADDKSDDSDQRMRKMQEWIRIMNLWHTAARKLIMSILST